MEPVRVRDLMTTNVLFAVGEDDSLATAGHRMVWLGCRHLPVTRGQEVVGVISDRDLLAWQAGGRMLDGLEDRVRAAMSTPAIVGTPDETVAEAAARMIASKIDCIPVVLHGRLVGILTTTDIVGHLVSQAFHRRAGAP